MQMQHVDDLEQISLPTQHFSLPAKTLDRLFRKCQAIREPASLGELQ
jgi:hypothetical protein